MKKIRVKARPNSRANSVKQIDADFYEVKVSVPPEKGKANDKIVELLAEHFGIPKSRIVIIKGTGAKEKILMIEES